MEVDVEVEPCRSAGSPSPSPFGRRGGPPARHGAGRDRAGRARTPLAPHGSAGGPRPAGSGGGRASSAPTGAPAPRAGPRRADGRCARSSGGRRSSGRSRDPCRKRAPARPRAQPSQRSRTKPWARMPQVRNSRNSRPKMDTQTQGLGRAARSIRCRAVRRLRVIQPDLGRRAIRASRRPARARCVPSGAPGARFPCRPKPTITTRAVQPNGAPTTARAHIRRYARRHGNCAAAGPSR